MLPVLHEALQFAEEVPPDCRPFALAVFSQRNTRLRLAVCQAQENNDQSPAPASTSSDDDRRYTLGHYYGSTNPVSGVKQLDHTKRRRDRVVAEIIEAGRRQGVPEQLLRGNLDELEALLPELTPDVSKMRAGDWAKLAKDINKVATMLVVIKTCYPGANVGRIVAKVPKVLLKSPEAVSADAAVVRRVLAAASNLDAIIEEVPYLMDPAALAQSLSNVCRWYNTQDPVSMIARNPKLLLNVEEADLEADPLYGELTTAG
ncbi:hypothetical protein Vretifemale_4374 [Volvox reticuliferus]|uniref:Uncharacterized protein n=2 Tax=Volvox reticuliferus TaxID=1737510 RepID=A0A8J4C5B7_9CHLO|nr:hypothetical protein Vretifemale_4374 [Volvox reticuliferus]